VERIFIGLLRLRIRVLGVSTLKGRRRPIKSLVDRVAHRHGVKLHEVEASMQPARVTLALTTCGNDQQQIRALLERVEMSAGSNPDLEVMDVSIDVFRWQEEDSFAIEDWDTELE
jgi:uncharacterized protein YlxP (DUF503 family)